MGLADRTPPTADEYAEYPKRFSNWGRWGDDDELGTLNFVTPDVRRAARRMCRRRPLGVLRAPGRHQSRPRRTRTRPATW